MKDNNMAVIGFIGLLSIRLSQLNCNNKWSFGRRGPGKCLHCLMHNPAEPQHQSCSTTGSFIIWLDYWIKGRKLWHRYTSNIITTYIIQQLKLVIIGSSTSVNTYSCHHYTLSVYWEADGIWRAIAGIPGSTLIGTREARGRNMQHSPACPFQVLLYKDLFQSLLELLIVTFIF